MQAPSYWKRAQPGQYIGWGSVGKNGGKNLDEGSTEDAARLMEETNAARKLARDFMAQIMAKEKAPMVRDGCGQGSDRHRVRAGVRATVHTNMGRSHVGQAKVGVKKEREECGGGGHGRDKGG